MGVSILEAPMFARVKKSGKYQYLQIVENNKVKGKVKQRVIATIGRLDHLQEKFTAILLHGFYLMASPKK